MAKCTNQYDGTGTSSGAACSFVSKYTDRDAKPWFVTDTEPSLEAATLLHDLVNREPKAVRCPLWSMLSVGSWQSVRAWLQTRTRRPYSSSSNLPDSRIVKG